MPLIETPHDDALGTLCDQLSEMANPLDTDGHWPDEQLRLCGEYGVYRWFMPAEWGGAAWNDADIARGYLRLSAACLTTTFIITQRTGACRRIVGSENESLKARLLPDLVAGRSFATVGISHLTTSRRHLGRPALAAREVDGGFVLDGFSPWVTGGPHASTIVVGAECDDGRQMLVALPAELHGVTCGPPARLTALSASHTGQVRCDSVQVGREWLIDGPVENVMSRGSGAGTGGLQTTTLAIGLAAAALGFLDREASKRPDLVEPAAALRREHEALAEDLLAAIDGSTACSAEQLRNRANSHVNRSAQAALAAAKGTGYILGHPTGRWCREALFFLVWSCPQPVLSAALCEFAGLAE